MPYLTSRIVTNRNLFLHQTTEQVSKGGMFAFMAESDYDTESGQIIIPASQVAIGGYPARAHDIYVVTMSHENAVVGKNQVSD